MRESTVPALGSGPSPSQARVKIPFESTAIDGSAAVRPPGETTFFTVLQVAPPSLENRTPMTDECSPLGLIQAIASFPPGPTARVGSIWAAVSRDSESTEGSVDATRAARVAGEASTGSAAGGGPSGARWHADKTSDKTMKRRIGARILLAPRTARRLRNARLRAPGNTGSGMVEVARALLGRPDTSAGRPPFLSRHPDAAYPRAVPDRDPADRDARTCCADRVASGLEPPPGALVLPPPRRAGPLHAGSRRGRSGLECADRAS